MEALINFGLFLGYMAVAGFFFRVFVDMTERPDEPFREPGPFFGALAWPIGVAFLIGCKLPSGMFSRDIKDEKRRRRELAEAQHRTELARERRREDEEITRQLRAHE